MEEIRNVIVNIKERTGLDVDLYTTAGEYITGTNDDCDLYEFKLHKKNEFLDGLFVDKIQNITYFLINSQKGEYIGVIFGANLISQNYAYMVSKLLESVSKNKVEYDNDAGDKSQKLKQILLGELSQSQIKTIKNLYNIAKEKYLVFYIVCDDSANEVFSYLLELAEPDDFAVAMSCNTMVFLKQCDFMDEYRSASEFAETLAESVNQEIGQKISIGIGGVAPSFEELSSVYSQAIAAYRLGKMADEKSAVYSYKEYILLRMIDDIPKESLKKYMSVFMDEATIKLFEDIDLMTTAEQFLNNSLNISETARLNFMHRNTLIYRLDKIENATGLNIRRFSDATTFRIMLIIYKFIKL